MRKTGFDMDFRGFSYSYVKRSAWHIVSIIQLLVNEQKTLRLENSLSRGMAAGKAGSTFKESQRNGKYVCAGK